MARCSYQLQTANMRWRSCGLSDELPVGLQLIGPQLSENTIFRAGHALERALGFDPVPERLR